MSEPYYSDDSVTLYHGDSRSWLLEQPDRSFDCVITDPPFDERTHTMARTNKSSAPAGGRALSGSRQEFASWDHSAQVELFEQLGRLTRRWVVSSLATDTAFRFQVAGVPDGLRLLRVGAWVKTNPMPIISADRPAMGWEPIAFMHRVDVKPSWHGGGRALNYIGPTAQGTGHPTSKPLPMVAEWVRMFTNPGDVILDPFSGSGTTARAAKDAGRRAVVWEEREDYCELIASRISDHIRPAADTLFGESA